MSEKKTIDRLIFIYNAGSGKLDAFIDSAKKLLTIKGCALCSITHSIAGEKKEWKECRQELGVPIDFYHKDEIPESFKNMVAHQLPCIVAQAEGKYIMLVSPDVLERCRGNVDDLKGRIHYYLSAHNFKIA